MLIKSHFTFNESVSTFYNIHKRKIKYLEQCDAQIEIQPPNLFMLS